MFRQAPGFNALRSQTDAEPVAGCSRADEVMEELCSASYTDLTINLPKMVLDRFLADAELAGNLAVAFPPEKMRENLLFSHRDIRRRMLPELG